MTVEKIFDIVKEEILQFINSELVEDWDYYFSNHPYYKETFEAFKETYNNPDINEIVCFMIYEIIIPSDRTNKEIVESVKRKLNK